jgi:hypothetical protein
LNAKEAKLSHDELLRLLKYDPGTGIFTRRIMLSNRARLDGVAGHLSGNGKYQLVSVDGVTHYAHRLAFFYMTGQWAKNVDHKDRNGLNNCWANLREATKSQNAGNSKRFANNTSGYKGVVWHKAGKKWLARISMSGRTVHLGSFSSKDEAVAAYNCAAQNHFGEFARVN